jgi:DNA (cytosine-5)-methyltransferase 1
MRKRSGGTHVTDFRVDPPASDSWSQDRLASAADQAFLRTRRKPQAAKGGAEVRVADLFCGCGAMSLGVAEACRALGLKFKPVLAVDASEAARKTYRLNFPSVTRILEDVSAVCDSALGLDPSDLERQIKGEVGRVDMLIGGPPCQGHSDLNNHTRRSDPKNGLYEKMARFAEILRPKHVIVENVPAVRHDSQHVVDAAVGALRRAGYHVVEGVVAVGPLGVAQTRRRHVLIASLERKPDLASLKPYARTTRSVAWAIASVPHADATQMCEQTRLARRTRKRIDYLFDEKLYDLPNEKRPKCQRGRSHTYKSVYGRLRWDKPAQTITTGFTCMGQGRYVHPKERRTLTAREAARLQFIPDFFRFPKDLPRTKIAQMIGNAVPPKLSHVLAVELLR